MVVVVGRDFWRRKARTITVPETAAMAVANITVEFEFKIEVMAYFSEWKKQTRRKKGEFYEMGSR